MKRNLLVTLSDDARLEQAMHLFSNIYFNSGWQGDYMLMAYKVSDKKLEAFRSKGILVKKVKSVIESENDRTLRIYSCKINLFKLVMKKWDTVIFLDNDTIVGSSLDGLIETKYFSAATEIDEQNVLYQFDLASKEKIGKFNRFKKNIAKK